VTKEVGKRENRYFEGTFGEEGLGGGEQSPGGTAPENGPTESVEIKSIGRREKKTPAENWIA